MPVPIPNLMRQANTSRIQDYLTGQRANPSPMPPTIQPGARPNTGPALLGPPIHQPGTDPFTPGQGVIGFTPGPQAGPPIGGGPDPFTPPPPQTDPFTPGQIPWITYQSLMRSANRKDEPQTFPASSGTGGGPEFPFGSGTGGDLNLPGNPGPIEPGILPGNLNPPIGVGGTPANPNYPPIDPGLDPAGTGYPGQNPFNHWNDPHSVYNWPYQGQNPGTGTDPSGTGTSPGPGIGPTFGGNPHTPSIGGQLGTGSHDPRPWWNQSTEPTATRLLRQLPIPYVSPLLQAGHLGGNILRAIFGHNSLRGTIGGPAHQVGGHTAQQSSSPTNATGGFPNFKGTHFDYASGRYVPNQTQSPTTARDMGFNYGYGQSPASKDSNALMNQMGMFGTTNRALPDSPNYTGDWFAKRTDAQNQALMSVGVRAGHRFMQPGG